MNKAEMNARLAQVKLAQALKLERLATMSKSKPKQKKLTNQAIRCRRQVVDLTR